MPQRLGLGRISLVATKFLRDVGKSEQAYIFISLNRTVTVPGPKKFRGIHQAKRGTAGSFPQAGVFPASASARRAFQISGPFRPICGNAAQINLSSGRQQISIRGQAGMHQCISLFA